MKVINYWEKFLSTGSINDYLNYRGEEAKGCKASETVGFRENEGAEKVEGTGQCYRDDIESGAHRGI